MEHREDLTQFMHRMAASQTLGLRQALKLLREEAYIRPLRETLAKYAGRSPDDVKGLRAFLVEKLMEQSPEGTVQENIDRKVRMWMNDRMQAVSKPGAIQICFALGLSPEEANGFLQRACGEGFHVRDPEEFIFLYALKQGLSYPEALALQTRMKEAVPLTQEKSGEESLLTDIVLQGLDTLESAADLEVFLRENQGRLGSFHNTAYEIFRGYLNLLTDPVMDYEKEDKKDDHKGKKEKQNEEEHMSVREVTDVYLHERMIPRIRQSSKKNPEDGELVLSALQRNIKQNWPDETTLSRMMNRKTDVSRKALILLFLATDGGMEEEYGYDEYGEEDEEEVEEEVFEDACSRMNGILVRCGFAPLDPRCAFDWMVLYCMCADAGDSLMTDSRVHRFLKEIFQTPREEG